METLQFKFSPAVKNTGTGSVLVGVVSSGNLEVLVEKAPLDGVCEFNINTAAGGFKRIWQAVLEDFITRHPVADTRFSINDAGAPPAVVSLRLDQAVNAFLKAEK